MESKNSLPPRFATKLLSCFIKDELAEEVLGDLDEKFRHTINAKTTTRAKLNYWYQVVNYIRPFALKNRWSNLSAFRQAQIILLCIAIILNCTGETSSTIRGSHSLIFQD